MDDTMNGGSDASASTDASETMQSAPADNTDESVSVFLPKAALHGEVYKPGDTITLTVKDVDPETGDVEAECSDDSADEKSEGGMMDDFEKAMPADNQNQQS